MTDIASAINIGPALAKDLREAGIHTLEELQAMGYREAIRRLRAAAPKRDCTHSMLALAGALEGKRWMALPADTRARVRQEAA
ncbi:MAG: TfoX/Sxy family DNA transformation protein [Chloroflexi bacterium]|nr:TfoX/Sxy family DNA transformation protein [Chloroflexota bacterium]